MWAHYSEKHKGAVIGIDFDKVIPGGITMHSVQYPEDNKRPEISIAPSEKWFDILLTKSNDWIYEKERRSIFVVKQLEEFKGQKLAFLKDFKSQLTWFLRLNPESIREVVFGLYTENSLKSAIEKLIGRPELQHVRLRQAKESETYTLNLTDIKK
jgi:Protein of unknown function (DUF2971)